MPAVPADGTVALQTPVVEAPDTAEVKVGEATLVDQPIEPEAPAADKTRAISSVPVAEIPKPPEEKPPPSPPPEPDEPAPKPAPRARVTTARVDARPEPERRLNVKLIGIAAAVVVAAVVGLLMVLGGGEREEGVGPGATGTLIINAVPWAEVEQVLDTSDTDHPLTGTRFTPVSLSLPPGEYRISLKNPGSSEPVVVEAKVRSGKIVRAPLAEFSKVDADEVLKKYGL
jgi:hypothetical protein